MTGTGERRWREESVNADRGRGGRGPASPFRNPCLMAGLILALAVQGCGPSGGEADGRRAGPPRAGDVLPALEVETRDGESVTLDRYRGRAVLLNLWATWCPPCRAEMPFLQALSERYGDAGLAVVGISVDDPGARPALEAFLGQVGVDYDILLDPGMGSMDRLGVLGLPATFLADTAGTVTLVRMGPVSEADTVFLAGIEAVLPEGS